MDDKYTKLSKIAFDMVMEANLEAEDVYSRLTVIQPRTFADILTKYSQEENIRKKLLDGFMSNDPSRKRESVERNIRDWLSGKRAPKPSDRDSLWELCFALGLTAVQADEFLATAGETGIHWRDPRELAFAFALKNQMSFGEAKELWLNRVKPVLQGAKNDSRESYTSIAKDQFSMMDKENELIDWITDNAEQMGAYHNRAWKRFESYLQALQQPEAYTGLEEKKYSIRDVLADYFCTSIPSAKDGRAPSGVSLPTPKEARKMSPIHQAIMEAWPDEITISRIRNRDAGTDVPRKSLMLLFLATDGIVPDPEDDDAEDIFCASYDRMNTMLTDCGYRKLDPRNAFDWLMLYCMRTVSDDEFANDADATLKKVLAVLFPDEERKDPDQ